MVLTRSWSRLAVLLLCVIVSTALLIPSSHAAATTTHQVHERRSAPPSGWTRGERLDRRKVIPLRIALTQSNMDRLDEYVMQVSDPASPQYGQHWTPARVQETFAPSDATRNAVLQWLVASGIAKERLQLSRGDAWIGFDATVAEAEALLDTEYYSYSHPRAAGGQKYAAVEGAYSLPSHIRPHVDFVTPTLHFDARLQREKRQLDDVDTVLQRKRDANVARDVVGLGSPDSLDLPKAIPIENPVDILNELEQCDKYITPICLRALYGIPILPSSTPSLVENPLAVVEYTPQAYVPEDLVAFFANYSKDQKQLEPTLISIDGGVAQQDRQGFRYNGESNLDLDYAMALANPLPVSLYQVGDIPSGGYSSYNDFLDALDGSYCTKDGGDDPWQDVSYPDNRDGGYKGEKMCGGAPISKVISTSYSYNEADLTPFYEQRQCAEYAKLGLLGTTFLYSTGDFGVAGYGGQCIDPSTGYYNNGGTGKFNPSFPGGCPYVLAVGATQVLPGNTVTDPESACYRVIYSGGGFSNVFAQPDYQASALETYYNTNAPNYTASQYNNSRTVRGFPDVSANGAHYIVPTRGKIESVYGTSASTPVFAAILALINEARAAIGKSTVGFVNPAIYANPSMFNDITNGTNPGCGTEGFSAVAGWDPVTGLGTPNYPKMLAYFLSN